MIMTLNNVKLTINGHSLVRIKHWEIEAGKVYGLAGDTGSGKSTIGKWLGNIEPVYWEVTGDDESFSQFESKDGTPVRGVNEEVLYLLQDAYQIFNPYVSIIRHFRDIWNHNHRNSTIQSFDEVLELVRMVGLKDSSELMKRKVDGISQGEAQRLAYVLSFIRPAAIRIYDEVFSNVDQESSRKMMEFLLDFCARTQTAAVVISHEKTLVREFVDDVYVIKEGEFIHDKLTELPLAPREVLESTPLIRIMNLRVPGYGFVKKRRNLLWELSEFRVDRSECVGLYGRSGMGKTTLLRGILGEHELEWAECQINGEQSEGEDRLSGLDIRYLPQSVVSIFNPAYPLRTSIREIQQVRGISDAEIENLLLAFGLKTSHLQQYSSELSGGEIQRMGLISVLMGTPDLVMLDESFSSVDEATREAIWSVIVELQKAQGFALLVVSHDTLWLRLKMNRVVALKKEVILIE